MEENNIDIEQIEEQIKKLKLEIIEKEEQIDTLLKIINNETDIDDEVIEEEN